MIEVIGEEGTAEYSAALQIRDALIQLWPGIESTPSDEELVRLAAGAKLSGYQVADFDIILCASFKFGRRFVPKKVVTTTSGQKVIGKPILVPNLFAAIEVKDHPAERIRISSGNIEVQYRNGKLKWSNATDQNVKQAHAIALYFEHFTKREAYAHRLVLLRGVDQVSATGGLGRAFKGNDLLTSFAESGHVRVRNGEYILSSAPDDAVVRMLSAPVFRRLAPTTLDRKRMDRIAMQTEESDAWRSSLGNKMVRLRGRGGSGKTICLLQNAWRSFQESAARTLVLTYNHALAADIRRSLALMNIPSASDSGGISVQTVMSFMYSWFRRLQVISEKNEFEFSEYNHHCETAVELLKGGAILEGDIAAIKTADPDRYDYDFILVDEAQDWPEYELEALKALYGPEKLILADGIDQLVRGNKADWEREVPSDRRQIVPLKQCLRMKNNLAVFANALASTSGYSWSVEPNSKAGGGRVIAILGSYRDQIKLHEELLAAAIKAGNAPLDFLIVVPPEDVIQNRDGRSSLLASSFANRGLDVWDGTNSVERRDFPRSIESFRFVQYESCRGLEGWTVICESLDRFWEVKKNQALQRLQVDAKEEYSSLEELAERAAWQWAMIPLTRPIDTLVISLADPDSTFSKAVLAVTKNYGDIAELISKYD